MKRICIATFVVLGLSACIPFAAMLPLRPHTGLPLFLPASILSVILPHAFVAFMAVLLRNKKAASIAMLVGAALVSAVWWVLALNLARHYFAGSLISEYVGRSALVGPVLQWPIVFVTAIVAHLLAGRAFIKQTMILFAGAVLFSVIYYLPVVFVWDFNLMAYVWLATALIVVVLAFLLVRTKPPIAAQI